MDILHHRREQNYAFSDFTVNCPFKRKREKTVLNALKFF